MKNIGDPDFELDEKVLANLAAYRRKRLMLKGSVVCFALGVVLTAFALMLDFFCTPAEMMSSVVGEPLNEKIDSCRLEGTETSMEMGKLYAIGGEAAWYGEKSKSLKSSNLAE